MCGAGAPCQIAAPESQLRLNLNNWTAIAAVAFAAFSPVALAEEGSAERAARLEQRLLELEAQVERLTAGTQAGASTELSARIAELERAVSAGDTGLTSYWKGGLLADSADGDFKLQIGGRIMLDYWNGDFDNAIERLLGSQEDPPAPAEKVESGTEFRRARLYMAGKIYGNVGFKAQFDFTDGDVGFEDVYMTLDQPCLGLITVGNQKEPIGLNNNTSSKYITFMERSTVAALAPGHNIGISVRDSIDGNWGWAVGAFRESDGFGDDVGNTSQGEWNFSGRLAGVVWEDTSIGENHLVHFGVSGALRNPANETVTLRTRGGQHLTSNRLSAVKLTDMSDEGRLYGLETGYVNGSLHFEAEWAHAAFDADGASGDAEVAAWAVTLGYFLTGESRPYSRKSNSWGRVEPRKNYGDADGPGAVEVAMRFDTWSPTGAAGSAPDIDQWTFGVNWYLNPHTRVMLNLLKGQVDDLGDYDMLGMRFQLEF